MKAEKVLYHKYQDLFDFTKVTIDESITFVVGERANTVERQVTLFHFVRTAYLLDAIYILCLYGRATTAKVILRSLFNLYIDIKWIASEDTQKRFERFADFEVIFKKLGMDDIVQHGDIWDEIKNDDCTVHYNEFERIKTKYHLKERKDFFNWSGKSIYEMAKEVGIEKDYKIIYGHLSSIEHTRPNSVRSYLDDSEKGKTKIKAISRDEDIDKVLITALEYYFQIKAITHNLFDVSWDNLKSVEQCFSSLRNKYWG
ncbi:MAG: DUF5677 domain-containing protein [Smithellaceae bacterium]|jgi:hypothetical protein